MPTNSDDLYDCEDAGNAMGTLPCSIADGAITNGGRRDHVLD